MTTSYRLVARAEIANFPGQLATFDVGYAATADDGVKAMDFLRVPITVVAPPPQPPVLTQPVVKSGRSRGIPVDQATE